MALWVYSDLSRQQVPRDEWRGADVRSWRDTSRRRGRDLSLLLSARTAQLLHETAPAVLRSVYGTTNLTVCRRLTSAYAHTAVRRALSQRDTIGRVLDLADADVLRRKLATRFYDLMAFVRTDAFRALSGGRGKARRTQAVVEKLARDVDELLKAKASPAVRTALAPESGSDVVASLA